MCIIFALENDQRLSGVILQLSQHNTTLFLAQVWNYVRTSFIWRGQYMGTSCIKAEGALTVHRGHQLPSSA